jgi:hypothetical protein
MTWNPETQDFPENRYADERYENLVALEWRIRLHADDRQTWADMCREIMRHLLLYPLRVQGVLVQRWQITEWRDHFCTLWGMRRWLERERNAAHA